MAFIKRLGFYLFGLAIGIVFLSIFLKKKSAETGVYFCYFPNCRTLKDIRSKPMYYSDEIQQLFLENKLDTLDISFFLNDGSVDFSESDTKSVPCRSYIIESELEGSDILLSVKNCPERATVTSLTYK